MVELEDIVVVERREKDGKIKLHQAVNQPAAGAAAGRCGAASSGSCSSCSCSALPWGGGGLAHRHRGQHSFMREVSANLRPGAAAVFALVKQVPADKVVSQITRYGAQLVQTSLSHEEEEQLKEVARAARGGAAGADTAG
ncbi:DUF1269 domain-containing protein [Streptomyces sp. NPDC096176]|uniref:DUF1269 domain-containing protein n=1 Tax=Streptomyces sp. NPDC096176 TaxID=3366079 RepID=UPI0037FF5181